MWCVGAQVCGVPVGSGLSGSIAAVCGSVCVTVVGVRSPGGRSPGGGSGVVVRGSELSWHRSRGARLCWAFCSFLLSFAAPFFVEEPTLPSLLLGLVWLAFWVLFGGGGFVMPPPCSPVFS